MKTKQLTNYHRLFFAGFLLGHSGDSYRIDESELKLPLWLPVFTSMVEFYVVGFNALITQPSPNAPVGCGDVMDFGGLSTDDAERNER